MLQEYSEGPTACLPTLPAQLPLTPFDTVPILPAEVNQDPDEDIVTEQVREVEKILQDLENGVADETLPWLTEDDVTFDMDEVVVEEEDVLDENESDTDGEENDIGWINMEERE